MFSASSSDTLISVQGLGKTYLQGASLAYWLKRGIQAQWTKAEQAPQNRPGPKGVIALDSITFEVKRGEAFGIIGRNGAGKSTLLQILSGTLRADRGSYALKGRVTALLELGSGFNPDFTGEENIYLAGSILGLGRKEMEQRFNSIARFADIGDFLYQPVKTYSTGMVMRVAFAVAISIEPDVLIIDEALSVGDILFQQKCAQRLKELLRLGVTLLVVTHDTHFVLNLCQRALWLDQGRQAFLGDATSCVRAYLAAMAKAAGNDLSLMQTATHEGSLRLPSQEALDLTQSERLGGGPLRIQKAWLLNEEGLTNKVFRLGDWAHLLLLLAASEEQTMVSAGCELRNRHGQVVFATGLRVIRKLIAKLGRDETRLVSIRFKLELAPAQYTLDLGCGAGEGLQNTFERFAAAAVIEIASSPSDEVVHGVARLPQEISIHTPLT